MGFTSAVHWWEEQQLRVLVLSSFSIQCILFASTLHRMKSTRARAIIWLAYLGGDALAIYALAVLFNRHKDQDRGCFSHGGNSVLQVAWTPLLLIHLGGPDGITAYNIEDNELWRRHVLTVVSQITVAIYVFCKSWPGGHERLFKAAIMLFVVGVLKCLEKPWALRSASINSLVSSSADAKRTADKEGKINSLQYFVRQAKAFISSPPQVVSGDAHPEAQEEAGSMHSESSESESKVLKHLRPPYSLFADLASPLPERLRILRTFWVLEEKIVFKSLQQGISAAFGILYTKLGMLKGRRSKFGGSSASKAWCAWIIRVVCMGLSWAAFGLLFMRHPSHMRAYNNTDVLITFFLFSYTAMMEVVNASMALMAGDLEWHQVVLQYCLIEVFVHNKNHKIKMRIMSLFGYKDRCKKPCFSSRRIIKLVLQYVKDGWKEYIRDVATYRKFSGHRGQWTLERHQCDKRLGWSLNGTFDESVLLWHVATDFCFYSSDFTGHICAFDEVKEIKERSISRFIRRFRQSSRGSHPSHQTQCVEHTCCKAVRCKWMSNYMMHLLYVNPEMLMPGTRRSLFKSAYKELKGMFKDNKLPRDENHEIGLTKRIIELESTEGPKEGFIHDAWALAKALRGIDDLGFNAEKMWEVVEGVWVEMLCYSASSCRGYLHAKALGSGGELLTYVWLLLSWMGIETLADKLQRPEFTNGAVDANATPSTSEVRTGTTSSTFNVPAGAAPSTSEIPTSATPPTSSAAPSTSEIRTAVGEDMV
ncbi:hypothetical protein ACP70R_044791 [Stipagrostis hirtigluma subsp. patula]